jgi:hypothetical protein
MEMEHPDEKIRRWLQHAVAKFLGVPLEAVRVIEVSGENTGATPSRRAALSAE